MEPSKPNADRGPSLTTAFWAVGSGFILAASLAFVAYLRYHLPWAVMVVGLGLAIGAVVAILEQFVARPLDRLTRGLQGVPLDGEFQFPPMPDLRFAPVEYRRLWRGLRVYQEQQNQARLARDAAEQRVTSAQRQARVLTAAARSLRPDANLADLAPSMLRDLAAILGVPAVYLVPLRRHCPVPVLGPTGTPTWADAVRESALDPWLDLLAQEAPTAISFTPLAPAWAKDWARRTLWVIPLTYHGRAQGVLLALPTGAERAYSKEELTLLEALAPVLAAGLHPPRWSEERKRVLEEHRRELEAAYADVDAEESRRRKRRRHKQGA
jgi:GAF domain-containing protein